MINFDPYIEEGYIGLEEWISLNIANPIEIIKEINVKLSYYTFQQNIENTRQQIENVVKNYFDNLVFYKLIDYSPEILAVSNYDMIMLIAKDKNEFTRK